MNNLYKYIMCVLLALATSLNASAQYTINDVIKNLSEKDNVVTFHADGLSRFNKVVYTMSLNGVKSSPTIITIEDYTISCSNAEALGEVTWNRESGKKLYDCDFKIKIPKSLAGHTLTVSAEWDESSHGKSTGTKQIYLPDFNKFEILSCTEIDYNSIERKASYRIKWSHPDWWIPGTNFKKGDDVVNFRVQFGNTMVGEGSYYRLEDISDDGCTLVLPDLMLLGLKGECDVPVKVELTYKSGPAVKKSTSYMFNCKRPMEFICLSSWFSLSKRCNVYNCFNNIYENFIDGYVCLLRDGKVIDYVTFDNAEQVKNGNIYFNFEDYQVEDGEEHYYTVAYSFEKPDLDRLYDLSNRNYKLECIKSTFRNTMSGGTVDIIEQEDPANPAGPKLKGHKISWYSDYSGDADLYYRLSIDGGQAKNFTFKGTERRKELYYVPKGMTLPEGARYIEGNDIDDSHLHTYRLEAFVNEADTAASSFYEWPDVGSKRTLEISGVSASEGTYTDCVCIRAKAVPVEGETGDPAFSVYRRYAGNPASEFKNIADSYGNGPELFIYDDHVDPNVKYEYKIEAYLPDGGKAIYTRYVTGYAKLEGTITGNVILGDNYGVPDVPVRLELVNENGSAELAELADSMAQISTLTDSRGNYIFRGIPIYGNSTTYRVLAMNGEHKYQPENVQCTLSKTTTVVQGVNFVDNSSFPLYLHVTYDGTNIPVDSVFVYVDGYMVQPAVEEGDMNTDIDLEAAKTNNKAGLYTDKDGRMKVEVSPGQHTIQVRRPGHTFVGDGYWPARDSLYDIQSSVGSEYEPIEFYDATKVIVAGRVVGGKVQATKPWTQSVANIGEATLELRLADQRYKLNTTDRELVVDTLRNDVACQATIAPGSDIINITTNAGTGEFYVAVPPVNFVLEEVRQVGGNLCSSAKTGQADFGNVHTQLLEVVDSVVIDTLRNRDGELVNLHGTMCIPYRAPKHVEMWDNSQYCGRNTGLFGDALYQYYDKIKDENLTLDLFIDNKHALGKPVFTNRNVYNFGIKVYESYLRPGADELDADVVPLVGEKFTMINGMGSTLIDTGTDDVVGSYNDVLTLDSLGEATYRWTAGFPKFADDHLLSLALRDEETGEMLDTLSGYVMGNVPIEGTDFVTWPREATMEVIHDPYGSGSYAYKESKQTTVNLSTYQTLGEHQQQNWTAMGNVGVYASRGDHFKDEPIQGFTVLASLGTKGEHKKETVNKYSSTVTYTEAEKITTNSGVSGVGAEADIFCGNAMNTIISDANGLWLKPKNEYNIESINDFEFKKERTTSAGIVLSTRFAYTRSHILGTLMPKLENDYKDILRKALYVPIDSFIEHKDEYVAFDEPIYITFYHEGDEKFASNPEDDYGSAANPKETSYAWIAPNAGKHENMVSAYANGLKCWKDAIEQDEKNQKYLFDKITDKTKKLPYKNFSISNGTSYSSSLSVDTTNTNSSTYKYNFKATLTTNDQVHYYFVGISGSVGGTIWEDRVETSDGNEFEDVTTYGYVLQENQEGCFLSQDVIEPVHDSDVATDSYVFILRGGQTENPYQKVFETTFHKDDKGNTYKIGESTQNLAAPVLNIKNGEGVQKKMEFYNLRIGQPVYLTLQVGSLSPQNYKPENYLLAVPRTEKFSGLALTVGGTNIRTKEIPYTLYQDEMTDVTLVITPTQTDTLDYENIKVRLYADGWDSWDTYDEVFISLHYTPSAGDVTVKSPSTYVSTKTDQKLNLIVDNYDRNLNGFSCIDLMYRKVGEPQFTHTLARFWKDEAASKAPHADEIPFVGDKAQAHFATIGNQNTIYYACDMSDPRIYEDGDYEIQAVNRALFVDTVLNKVTICENPSAPWQIHKDTTRPQLLGKTMPLDGLLTPDTQIGLVFNEDVDPRYITKDSISITANKFKEYIDFDYILSDRKLIIEPKTDRGNINGDELTITVKGINDLAGNPIADVPAWKVKVDWLPLKWDAPLLSTANGAEVQYMEPKPVTIKVKNHSGRQQYFTITDKPEWLAVKPTEGTVGPYDDMELTILANDRLPLGTQTSGMLTMDVDEDGMGSAYSISQKLKFTVSGIKPDWRPDNPHTETNMSAIIKVNLPIGVLIKSEDMIAAFSGNECIGVAKCINNANGFNQMATMTIHQPENNDADISFKIWANNAVIYDSCKVSTPFRFVPDSVAGTVNKPVVVSIGNKVTREIDIVRGSNWISLGVNTDSMTVADIFDPLDGDSVTTVVRYDDFLRSQYGMATGTLAAKTVAPQDMFNVRYSNSDNMTLSVSGKLVNGETLIYDIKGYNNRPDNSSKNYWNWISYPHSQPLDVKYALCKLDAVDGDVIKGQKQFAMFYDGEWHGSLEILYPNRGYKFGSAAAEDRKMSYSTASYLQYLPTPVIAKAAETGARNRRMVARAKGADEQMWTPIYGYSDNMCVRAVVMDGEEHLSTGEVGAFDADGRCRGAQRISEDGYVYLTIGGEEANEPILFRYCDDMGEIRDAIATLAFKNDGLVGILDEPYVIQLNPEYTAISDAEANAGGRIIATFDVAGRRIATGATPVNAVVINLIQHADGSLQHVKVINRQTEK